MGHILKFMPLPLLAALFAACSGSADPEPTTFEGDSEQALAADSPDAADADVADKGRRGRGHDGRGPRGRHGRGRGHGHHNPPPEPSGQSCEVAGQSFADGAGVPSGDSCNSCGCNDGSVICTLALCEPVFCAEFLEVSDGVCSRFPLDPCKFQDPDCDEGGASCEAAGQTFPDGSAVPSGDSCNSCGCNDGSIACTEIACEPQVCALFVEVADGVCSRFPLDPCISQDPDCIQSGGASCEAAGQTFADGEAVPSGDSCNGCACNDGTVICTAIFCEPSVCALFVEESDGVCSRFPLDPCKSQDPDCLEPPPDPTDPGAP
jgi:hypothetical protein